MSNALRLPILDFISSQWHIDVQRRNDFVIHLTNRLVYWAVRRMSKTKYSANIQVELPTGTALQQ